jgi:hypothetical protein
VEVSVIINETYKKCGYYVSGYFIYFLSAFWHSRNFKTHGVLSVLKRAVSRVCFYSVYQMFPAKAFLPHSENKLHYNCFFQRAICEKLNAKQTENTRFPNTSWRSAVEKLTVLDNMMAVDDRTLRPYTRS